MATRTPTAKPKLTKAELNPEVSEILQKGNIPKIIYLIKKANAPLPPENSTLLRIVIVTGVLLGIYACYEVQEISFLTFILVSSVMIIGNIFSAITRNNPYSWIKIILAIAATSVFLNTVVSVIGAATQGNIPSILSPLASLFMWTVAIHSFDVPARRDLTFSLSGSAGLIAVASAQAIDSSFGIIVIGWLFLSIISLNLLWKSQVNSKETAKQALIHTLSALTVAAVVAFTIVLILPPPKPLRSLTFPSSIQNRVPVSNPGGLTQGGATPSAPAKPGQPGGKVQVGGYLGFAGPLNTGLRGSLSNKIIMRVRATKPGYWLGETFNTWNGQSWTQTPSKTEELTGNPSFYIPFKLTGEPPQLLFGLPQNTETFYIAAPLPNLLFGTESPVQIYYPDSHLYLGGGRSIRTRDVIDAGTIYTVISREVRLTPTQLQNIMPAGTSYTNGLPQMELATDLQLPKPYYRVKTLAKNIVEQYHARSTYQIVSALESWMGIHMRYSLNIPPLPPHADSVDEFLFVTKTGFCEQISSALVVMLRSLGIPAREAVGYVSGSYNPITNLYQVKASDAHAWVQVWYGQNGGWQDTDPTASVPYSTPSPGKIILKDTVSFIKTNLITILLTLIILILLILIFRTTSRIIGYRKLASGQKIIYKLNKFGARFKIQHAPEESISLFIEKLKQVNEIKNKQNLILKLESINRQFDDLEYNPETAKNHKEVNKLKAQIFNDLKELSKSI